MADLRKQADMDESSADAATRKKERQREYMRRYRKANRAKLNEQARQYRAANLERSHERDRRYAAANREKRRERGRQYYAENRDELRQRQRAWRESNRDYLRERRRRYYAENRERIGERVNQYRAANPERVSEWRRRSQQADPDARRRYGLKYTHGLDDAARSAMWRDQEGRCYLCGHDLDPATAVIEHWHGCPAHSPKKSCPICRRGLACHQCNVIIGLADEDPVALKRIADSLKAANAQVQARQRAAPEQPRLL